MVSFLGVRGVVRGVREGEMLEVVFQLHHDPDVSNPVVDDTQDVKPYLSIQITRFLCVNMREQD